MRFTRKNWVKFFDGSNKKTTIRVKKSKIKHHKAYAGSYFKPELLGEFDINQINRVQYKNLTEEDARFDGFKTLEELKNELERLNGIIEPDTIVYQHWCKNARNTN